MQNIFVTLHDLNIKKNGLKLRKTNNLKAFVYFEVCSTVLTCENSKTRVFKNMCLTENKRLVKKCNLDWLMYQMCVESQTATRKSYNEHGPYMERQDKAFVTIIGLKCRYMRDNSQFLYLSENGANITQLFRKLEYM